MKKRSGLFLFLFVAGFLLSSLAISGCLQKEHGGKEMKEPSGTATKEHGGS